MTPIASRLHAVASLAGVVALSLTGCTALSTQVLVDDETQPRAPVVSHCAGHEWTDNSLIAVVPLPIIGFAMPTQEINEIEAPDVLAKCGPVDRLANRRVEVDRSMCVPMTLTRVLSLGIWHWCPAHVSWEADVTSPPPPAEVTAVAPTAPVINEFNRPTYRLGAQYR
jgi:hypothetical protein